MRCGGEGEGGDDEVGDGEEGPDGGEYEKVDFGGGIPVGCDCNVSVRWKRVVAWDSVTHHLPAGLGQLSRTALGQRERGGGASLLNPSWLRLIACTARCDLMF